MMISTSLSAYKVFRTPFISNILSNSFIIVSSIREKVTSDMRLSESDNPLKSFSYSPCSIVPDRLDLIVSGEIPSSSGTNLAQLINPH
jgi:hypothetical protein